MIVQLGPGVYIGGIDNLDAVRRTSAWCLPVKNGPGAIAIKARQVTGPNGAAQPDAAATTFGSLVAGLPAEPRPPTGIDGGDAGQDQLPALVFDVQPPLPTAPSHSTPICSLNPLG